MIASGSPEAMTDKGPGPCARRAAADRAVDHGDAALFGFFGNLLDQWRTNGTGVDQRLDRAAANQAIVAKTNRTKRIQVWERHEHGRELISYLPDTPDRAGLAFQQGCHCLSADVEHGEFVSAIQEFASHRQAHVSDSDKSKFHIPASSSYEHASIRFLLLEPTTPPLL